VTQETPPPPHQLTLEECAADAPRARLNRAKIAAHEAYVSANRAVHQLNEPMHANEEPVDEALIVLARASRERAWALYTALMAETEW
jgi:hypothetical protein